MSLEQWSLVLGTLTTLLGTILSFVAGIFMLKSQRRLQNASAAEKEAIARSTDNKDQIELSGAALELVQGIRTELDRVKADYQAENKALKADNEQLKARVSALETENVNLKQEYKKENSVVRQENEALKARVSALETENAQLKLEIKQLQNGGQHE